MKKMNYELTQLSDFDAADYLQTSEDITAFLDAAMQEAESIDDDADSSAYFVAALGDAAKAEKKMTAIANRADVGRESLYKSLRTDANPSFRTVLSAIRELGGHLNITSARV